MTNHAFWPLDAAVILIDNHERIGGTMAETGEKRMRGMGSMSMGQPKMNQQRRTFLKRSGAGAIALAVVAADIAGLYGLAAVRTGADEAALQAKRYFSEHYNRYPDREQWIVAAEQSTVIDTVAVAEQSYTINS
jgi:hypothetical protein